jgi:hypothetical protein
MTKACRNCLFSHGPGDPEKVARPGEYFRCRRNAPVPYGKPEWEAGWTWPIVRGEDWCGEWKSDD